SWKRFLVKTTALKLSVNFLAKNLKLLKVHCHPISLALRGAAILLSEILPMGVRRIMEKRRRWAPFSRDPPDGPPVQMQGFLDLALLTRRTRRAAGPHRAIQA